MLILLLVTLASAARPSQLQIYCNDADRTAAWLQGAFTSMTLIVETLFGGFGCDGHLKSGCYENTAQIDATTCISTESPACDDCNLEDELAIEDVCCEDTPYCGEEPHMDGDSVCRTNRMWLALAFGKLYNATDEYDAQNYDRAHNLACAAERVLTQVLTSLGSPFVDDAATYKHIISAKETITFEGVSGDLIVETRTVQAFRQCGETCGDHRLIATYSLFDLPTVGGLPVGINQLLWPISGTISAFHKTGLPTNSFCALSQAYTTITNETHRLSTLGHLDFARVVAGFSRCDGFPVSCCVQGFHDLSEYHCCNTLPLIKDIGALLSKAQHPPLYAFAYVAHFKSHYTYEEDPSRSLHIGSDLLLRTAAADQCTDAAGNTYAPTSVAFKANRLPQPLAPGESRCVGGSDSGKRCTARNPCGADMACTQKPGSQGAFCFDGTWWNQKMPCSLDAQCAYGDCWGAASGHSGTALPFATIWTENNCDDAETATRVCNDQQVRAWYLMSHQK